MTNEIQTIEAKELSPLSIIQAAVQSGTGADELSKLMDLQERYEAGRAQKAFSAAMAQFQSTVPTIHKNKQADRYTFASFDEIMRTIKPHLSECGLSVRFSTKTEGTIITSICTISHRDGHSETTEFSAPVDPNMRVNETQKVGSANSYSKRYCLINALNLSVSDDIDDDGKAAGTQFATDEQWAELRDFVEAGVVDDEQQKWLKKHENTLTQKQAETALTRLRAAA